ncbi:MAG: aspartate/glutamate racemase family protein [Chloroflexota bacterium]
MATRVAAIHTALSAIKPVGDAFREVLPEVEVVNIIDDGIVSDALKAGKVDQNLMRRMLDHFAAAHDSGAAAILLCCSTVGETADVARLIYTTPIVKIDEAMAEKAVATGTRVGVLATVESTVNPSTRLIQRKAAEVGRQVEVKPRLVAGAWQALAAGDGQKHDQLVVEALQQLAKETDVVVLAQATIARILPQIGDLGVPVLSSPRSAVERVKQVLKLK